MEEILASIRRIIEDSDPGRKQFEEPAGLQQDFKAAPAEEAEIETFRAELRVVPETKKPFTLADVQAKIAAELPPAGLTRTEPDEAYAQPRVPTTLAEIGAQVVAESRAAVGQDVEAPATPPESADTIVADWQQGTATLDYSAKVSPQVETPREPRFELQPDIEISEDELAENPSPKAMRVDVGPAPISADVAPRPALVSEHTGRQVAAAFGELSEAFANRSKKTFDEMAEEMLRPMLRDWLDNNLPTLVERLVREEIERVARGV
jgi:cell pole-organizing protein PopZ